MSTDIKWKKTNLAPVGYRKDNAAYFIHDENIEVLRFQRSRFARSSYWRIEAFLAVNEDRTIARLSRQFDDKPSDADVLAWLARIVPALRAAYDVAKAD